MDRLREIGPTILADAGDFAAAADLDIDVGVVGNHELEWGIAFARARDRFPAPVCQLSRIWPSPEGGSRDGRWFRWLRRPDLP